MCKEGDTTFDKLFKHVAVSNLMAKFKLCKVDCADAKSLPKYIKASSDRTRIYVLVGGKVVGAFSSSTSARDAFKVLAKAARGGKKAAPKRGG